MEFKNLLAAFGLVAIVTTGVLANPAAIAAQAAAPRSAESIHDVDGPEAPDSPRQGLNAQQSTVPFSFTRESVTLQVENPAKGDFFAVDASGWVVPVFSGTATPGATIQIQGPWGDVFGTATADAATGVWSLEWDFAVLPNHYIGGATVELVGGVEIDREGYDFMVTGFVEMDTLQVENPAKGDFFAVDASGWVVPVFSGTATPGAAIQIQGPWGDVFGTATADAATGVWSLEWDFAVLPNHYIGGATVELVGGVEIDREGYDFTATE